MSAAYNLLDPAELLAVLQGFNPWWTGRPVPAPAFRRLAFDGALRLLETPGLRRAILLSGPRRVGKTTVLHQLASHVIGAGRDPRSVLYLSLDHPLLKLVTLAELLRLYGERVHAEGKPALLLLDEVHYAREWELEVKQLIDHRPELQVVATGSASVVQHGRLAESGVGRWVTLHVPTLSFYEFVHLRGERVPELPQPLERSLLASFKASDAERASISAALRPLLPSFHRYLLVGGFPETARLDDTALCQRLLREDVVERVLKRDMTSLFGVRNVDDLERVFIHLCLNSGGILAHQTVAEALGANKQTVASHLLHLEQANLAYRLAPFHLGGKQALKARYKYYLVDAALRNAVLLRSEEALERPEEMGLIVETAVLRHFHSFHFRERAQMGYWRDPKTEREVDLIVRTPAATIPIEVKYRDRATLEARGGLALYCKSEAIPRAYLVTRRDTDFGVDELEGGVTQVLRIPAHVLCYLLGSAERALWN
ncbi:MAG: ATP-binding protein [Planctomycetaceae bacterium]|nr:ATP-binding protein [Planctomycetaceae bacterium]